MGNLTSSGGIGGPVTALEGRLILPFPFASSISIDYKTVAVCRLPSNR
jgi:hypothetical protein